MNRFFVSETDIDTDAKRVTITGGDAHHIKDVLRLKVGEEISVCIPGDAQEREFRYAVSSFEGESVVCELRFIKKSAAELPVKVTLYQGTPKSDKMEMIIQKCVELGIHSIVPVDCIRCVSRIDGKKADSKTARWQAISEAAAKQSKRGIVPEIVKPMSFDEALSDATGKDVILLPYEMAIEEGSAMDETRRILSGIKPGQSVAVFIGPEGGFDDKEVAKAKEAGARIITLGDRILRTETAGMTVMAWIGYLFG